MPPATPVISCVLPAYNAQRDLASAIDSILAQSFQDFELIIVNDGSADRTPHILDAYSRRDPRIRVLTQPNAGIVAALNAGIALSRSPLIVRMDADDLAMPDRFAKQLDYLTAHPDCVLLGSRVLMIDSDDYPIGDMACVAHGHDVIDDALLHAGWPLVHPAVVFRRDAFERAGHYREGTFPNEDHDLFLRLAEQGRVDNLPDHLLRYRRHLPSVTFAKSEQSARTMAGIIQTALARRGVQHAYTPLPLTPPKPSWWHRKEWVWQALREGHVPTARRHARGVLWERPLSKESWRAAYCAARGH